jgi:hypothetical protein
MQIGGLTGSVNARETGIASAVLSESGHIAGGGGISCGMARKGRPKPPEMQRALDAVGGIQALAQLLNVSPPRVARWRTIPAEYAVVIEAKIGLARERVRPDRTITRRGG